MASIKLSFPLGPYYQARSPFCANVLSDKKKRMLPKLCSQPTVTSEPAAVETRELATEITSPRPWLLAHYSGCSARQTVWCETPNVRDTVDWYCQLR